MSTSRSSGVGAVVGPVVVSLSLSFFSRFVCLVCFLFVLPFPYLVSSVFLPQATGQQVAMPAGDNRLPFAKINMNTGSNQTMSHVDANGQLVTVSDTRGGQYSGSSTQQQPLQVAGPGQQQPALQFRPQ